MNIDERRAALAAFGLLLLGFLAYVLAEFVAVIVVSVFVYYSTRPLYNWLGFKTDVLPRLRAVLTIVFFSLPLVAIVTYTVFLVATGVRDFVEGSPLADSLGVQAEQAFTEQLPEIQPESLIGAYRAGEFDVFIGFLRENLSAVAGFVSGFFLNTVIVVVVTYYLLIEGKRIRRWVLRYDDGGVTSRYLRTADAELKAVLFGNLLNVIAISAIAIAVFLGYNFYAPDAVKIPAPVLAGALTGLASLVPVVGMKVVYVPLTLFPAANAVLASETDLLVYVAGFLVATVVVVDFIPDIALRPYITSDRTHVGLLMLAYIFGPVVFGFYGLFLVPIVLVLALTFVKEALPYVLGQEEYRRTTEQVTLDGVGRVPSLRRSHEAPESQAELDEF